MLEFGVSRPTLREAFRILEAEGLISISRGTRGGALIHRPNVRSAARHMSFVLQANLISQSATAHERLAAGLVPSDPMIRWSLPNVFNGSAASLEAINGEVTRQASMMAYDTVFAWMGVGTVLIVPLVLMMRAARTRGEKLQEIHVE